MLSTSRNTCNAAEVGDMSYLLKIPTLQLENTSRPQHIHQFYTRGIDSFVSNVHIDQKSPLVHRYSEEISTI